VLDPPLFLVSITGSSEPCALVPLIKNLGEGGEKLHTEKYNWVKKREYSFDPH